MQTRTALDFRHVGIVVPQLEVAMEHLSQIAGIEWNSVREIRLNAYDGEGKVSTFELRVCLSVSEPGFELIEQVPGTPWACNDSSNLHHISFATTEVAKESNALSAADCPLVIAMQGQDASPQGFAYHRDPLGIIVEMSSIGHERPSPTSMG